MMNRRRRRRRSESVTTSLVWREGPFFELPTELFLYTIGVVSRVDQIMVISSEDKTLQSLFNVNHRFRWKLIENITSLEIHYDSSITDFMLSKFTRLTRLIMVPVPSITEKSITALVNLQEISYFTHGECLAGNDYSLHESFIYLTNLRELNMSYGSITGDGWCNLTRLRRLGAFHECYYVDYHLLPDSLTELDLYCTAAVTVPITHLTNLSSLILAGMYGECLENLTRSNLTNLTNLTLNNVDINPEYISHLTLLKSLDITDFSCETIKESNLITGDFLRKATNLTDLTWNGVTFDASTCFRMNDPTLDFFLGAIFRNDFHDTLL